MKGRIKMFEIETFDSGNPRKSFKLGFKREKESSEELNPAMHPPCQARQFAASGARGKEPL